MPQMLKHVGKFGEKPCVVVFRELPGEPEYCLIVQTDFLESRQHDDLMNVVQSAEAQEANDISQVLHRRQFTDGSNMLSTLHYAKKLQKVPVSHVNLTPMPNQSIALSDVNKEIRKIEGGYTPPKTETSPQSLKTSPREELNASVQSVIDTGAVDDASVAKNLLSQALLMEEDATALLKDAETKKQEAYKLDPSLRPPGRPKKIR